MMFEIELDRSTLSAARLSLSPHCDLRPATASIDLLVIHGISLPPGVFGQQYIEDLFLGRLSPMAHPYFANIAHLKVSTHLLIRRDGEVVQFVPFDQRAWHAGQSNFAGRSACNDFSIGIELEGADHIAYEDIQYQHLAAVTRCLIKAYPGIDANRIVGHNEISPGRKTDPGLLFDWRRYYGLMGFSK